MMPVQLVAIQTKIYFLEKSALQERRPYYAVSSLWSFLQLLVVQELAPMVVYMY
ncbi:hypothetical protein D3C85_1566010 [compost metagenome]